MSGVLIFHCTYAMAKIMEIEIEGEKKSPTILTPSTSHAVTYLFVVTGPGQRLWAVVPGTQSRGLGPRTTPEFPASLLCAT